jgi:hypothetical protein
VLIILLEVILGSSRALQVRSPGCARNAEALIGPFEEFGYPGITLASPSSHQHSLGSRELRTATLYPLDRDGKWQIEARNVLSLFPSKKNNGKEHYILRVMLAPLTQVPSVSPTIVLI